jgi:hypothetical protein
MASDQEVLSGEVIHFYHGKGNRPAKLIVAGEETFELTIYPANGVEQPWDEQTHLPVLDGLPTDLVGSTIQAIAEPKGEYNGVAQYKPIKITLLGTAPTTQVAPARAQATAQRPAPRLDSQRDSIERQVAAKGAIELVSTKTVQIEEFDQWFEHILDKIQGREAVVVVDAPAADPDDDFGSL